MLPILFNLCGVELLEAEIQEKKLKKLSLENLLFCVKCPFLLTLTLEKTKFIPSCAAIFRWYSACAILFENTKLKDVKILLYKF